MPEAPERTGIVRRIIPWMWVIALTSTILSMIPYRTLIAWLGKMEADGTFDSLSESSHLILALTLKVSSLVILVGIAFLSRKTEESEARLLKFRTWLKSIQPKEEIRVLWLAIRGEKGNGIFWIGILVLMIMGVFIRWKMISYPVWYDEAYTFVKFASRPFRYIITDYSAPNNHIFHSLLVALVYRIAGIHLWALRLPALAAGIILIPAVFLTGRKMSNSIGGFLAACAITIAPALVDFSVNARGYTLVCLFAALSFWLALEIADNRRAIFWILLVLCSVLGFYTIPTYLYPIGGIFLWLLGAGLHCSRNKSDRVTFLMRWLAAGLITVGLIFLVYSPVILFGTGFQSIVGHEFIRPEDANKILSAITTRSVKVWEFFSSRVPFWITWISVIGFTLHVLSSVIKFRKAIPFWLITSAWIFLTLILQRVVAVPRIWLFLLVFYILLSVDGWMWISNIIFKKMPSNKITILIILAGMLGITAWAGFSEKLLPKASNIEESHNEQAAKFISQNIPPDMALIGVAPTPIQVSYYMLQQGIPYNRFYDLNRPEDLSAAWVIVVEKSKFPTLDDVLTHQYPQGVDEIQSEKVLFTYKRLSIVAVTFKP